MNDETIKNALLFNYKEYLEIMIDGAHPEYGKDKWDSPLERMFFILLRETNALYGFEIFKKYKYHRQYRIKSDTDKTYYIDFVFEYKNLKIAIEIDGFKYHDRNVEQFEYERRRQNVIIDTGFKLLRYTYRDIRDNIFDIVSVLNHEYNTEKCKKGNDNE